MSKSINQLLKIHWVLDFEHFKDIKRIKYIVLSAFFRLFWPKSKCYDYLYQEAEALLKTFPIQATISFYEESDSEDEIEELVCEN